MAESAASRDAWQHGRQPACALFLLALLPSRRNGCPGDRSAVLWLRRGWEMPHLSTPGVAVGKGL